ncbi:MAG: hypothetical protein PHF29_02395 [Candidatus Riflebacteria bacterium]|nr:hypothetical protein [Candidatus Riflebacteria bacterium]
MKKSPHIVLIFILFISTFFISGCDILGSDSSSSSSVPLLPTSGDNDPNAKTVIGAGVYITATDSAKLLAKAGTILEFSDVAQGISVELPVERNREVVYSLIVNNEHTSAQSIQLLHETAASIKASIYEQHYTPLPSQDMTNTRWGNLEAKALTESNLRRQNKFQSLRNGAKGSLRGSVNHSNENLNDEVIIKIITDGNATSYNNVTTKLLKITEHAKFFVDITCSGTYNITSDDLNHFADEFESFIYPLFNDNYRLAEDVDSDGKLSIVFSKEYNRLGFAGLFNTADFSNPGNGNNRDMIGIWAPGYSAKFQGEYWRAATRETIAHELQHAANFSAKGLNMQNQEYEWLDESLSVGVEARYRQRRAAMSKTTSSGYIADVSGAGAIEPDSVANDNRFGSWLESSNTGMESWESTYAHYGQKGLFNFYMYEQFRSDFIKAMHNSSTPIGSALNIETLLLSQGDGRNYEQVKKDWQTAVLNEVLVFRGIIQKSQITDSKHKFNETMFPAILNTESSYKLTKDIDLGNGSITTYVNPGAAVFYKITQPAGYSGNNTFRIASEGKGVSLRMVRLTPN